jgi:putative hydrolase of the HAD superfamily
MNRMPSCLLFDLDDTLYSSRYGLEENTRRRMRVFISALLQISPEAAWQQRMAFERQYGTTLEWLMEEKGFTDVESYFTAIHPPGEADSLPEDPKLKVFLESLSLPKAILTNSPMEHAELILNKLGLSGLFTRVFDIRQNNFKGKPHSAVYGHALRSLGLPAAEVLFVDDNPLYVQGYIALGGRGLLIDEYNVHSNYPHPKIRELQELAQFIN